MLLLERMLDLREMEEVNRRRYNVGEMDKTSSKVDTVSNLWPSNPPFSSQVPVNKALRDSLYICHKFMQRNTKGSHYVA